MLDMHEVTGSIPVVSTKKIPKAFAFGIFLSHSTFFYIVSFQKLPLIQEKSSGIGKKERIFLKFRCNMAKRFEKRIDKFLGICYNIYI